MVPLSHLLVVRIPDPQLAPMSTSSSLQVALQYARGGQTALVFKLSCSNFMNSGCDLSILSAFPHEREYVPTAHTDLLHSRRSHTSRLLCVPIARRYLFPPLTYLEEPVDSFEVDYDGTKYVVLEVVPFFPS